mgnify:CR=1 FL=1
MHEIPEKALKCFETWSGLQVTFYDWTNSFTNCIVQERRLHMNEFCRVRKISLQYANCLQCDYLQTQSKAWMLRDGAVKICHAGALELVVSIFSGYRFLAILTAGLRRPPEMLPDHRVKVYFEKPDAKDCFHSAVCYLPDYKWEDINGFTPAEIARYQELVESTAHLILQFSKEGGVENAAGF